MERKRKFFQNTTVKRVLSFVLVFAMVVTMGTFSQLGEIVAKAGDGSYRLYFELPEGTVAGDWAVNAWSSVEVTGGSAVRIGGTWGDQYKPTLIDNNDGWGYVDVTGNVEGLQFVEWIKDTNDTGTNPTTYNCWNAQIANGGYETAYFAPSDGKWYADAGKTTEIKEPEIRNIFILAGVPELAGSNWNPTDTKNQLLQDESDQNKYSITYKNVAAGTYEYKILQDPENKGWDLPWGPSSNRSVTVEKVSDVTFTINITDTEKNVAVTQTPVESGEEPGEGEGGEDTPGETAEINVTDWVQVQVGDTTVPMQLYRNGVYETSLDLAAGSYDVQVLINGTAYAEKHTVEVVEAGKVYFRLKDGVLQDSVHDKIVHSAALVGNFTGIEFVDEAGNRYDIAGWNPADANGELTYYGGGLYGRTFLFQELAADLEIADTGYKVAFDDTWDYSIGNGSSNIALTIPAGRTSLTIFVDEINGVVYDDVRTADFDVVQNGGAIKKNALTTTVSFIGDARGDGDNNWNAGATGYEFTQISDTLFRYQKAFAKGTYNYKCVFDYKNWYEAEDGNRTIVTTAELTNVIFLYNTVDGKLYDTVNNVDKVAELLGMKAAPAKMEVVDNANGTTKFIALAADGAAVTLYYGNKAEVEKDGTSALKTAAMSKVTNGACDSGDIFLGDAALDVVYYYEINGQRVLDGSNATVKIGEAEYSNYKRDAFTGRGVNVPGTFPGPSWDAASNQMTYNGNGLYSYTFKDVPAANYEFKISMGSWAENYGKDGVADGQNMAVTVPAQQDVTIWYNDFSHRTVTSVNYVFADIDLKGTNIPDGMKLKDDGLTGIYSATVNLPAGTYSDVKIVYSGTEDIFGTFTLTEAKNVTFYFDPDSEIKYHNASDSKVNEDKLYFDSKDEAYKSVYGAVATGEEVTFSIVTGDDATEVTLIVKGREKKAIAMEKAGAAADGIQKWSAKTSFQTIGEYTYYFAVSNGSSVVIYADDDGYYGTGMSTDLTNVTPYELVVYKAGFETPDWMKNAVIYQIFPDRFFDGDESNNRLQTSARGEVDYEYITDWYTLPENPEQEELLDEETYRKTGAFYGDRNWSNEIYGGDLAGITERIDYLKALGVNVIYLNPVFSSISSHRYDASDYTIIDPILGDLGDFKELVKVAEENDMHIILDGVFNHVSDDSIYFDRYYKFLTNGTDTIGAYPYWAYVYDYMAEKSVDQAAAEAAAKVYFTENYGITDYSYTEWFDVFTTSLKDDKGNAVCDNIGLRAGKPVYGYDGWWGYDNMPIIKATNGSEFQTGDWAEEIIYNADETSVTQYWLSEGSDGWRLDVANEVSDETWQNFRQSVKALNSEAVIIGEIWDDATEYLLGDMYDSVMNYMFRKAVTGFAKGSDASEAVNILEKLRERYPEEAFYAMMNLVGSHDTTRILSYLDGIDDDRNQKDIDSAFPTYEKTSDLAKQRQYLVAFLQFTYAGAPTIYYGDEIGMVGSDDPDDRRAFEWGKGNEALVSWYASLANVRSQYAALRTGHVEMFDAENESILSYVRRDDKDVLVVLANNKNEEQQVAVNLSELGVSAAKVTDVLSGTAYAAENGVITVKVPALSGVILTENAKEISIDKKALAPAFDPAYVVKERSANYVSKDVTVDSEQDLQKVVMAAEQANDGDTIVVTMEADIEVPAELFDAISGKDVTVVVNVDEKAFWTINGKNVGGNNKSLSLGVVVGGNTIPAEKVNSISGGCPTIQLSLSHDGAFGFDAVLSVYVGTEYANKYANLFYFNEVTGTIEYAGAYVVDQNGYAAMVFYHASDYVIVMNDVDMKPVEDGKPGGAGDNNSDNSNNNNNNNDNNNNQPASVTQTPATTTAAEKTGAPDTGDHAPIAQAVLILLLGGAVLAATMSKKRKNG